MFVQRKARPIGFVSDVPPTGAVSPNPTCATTSWTAGLQWTTKPTAVSCLHLSSKFTLFARKCSNTPKLSQTCSSTFVARFQKAHVKQIPCLLRISMSASLLAAYPECNSNQFRCVERQNCIDKSLVSQTFQEHSSSSS